MTKNTVRRTYTYPDGSIYVGQLENDCFSGQGSMTLANGDTYVGEFKDDEFNGQGTYTFGPTPSGLEINTLVGTKMAKEMVKELIFSQMERRKQAFGKVVSFKGLLLRLKWWKMLILTKLGR